MDSFPISPISLLIVIDFMLNNVVRIYVHYVRIPNNQYEIESHVFLEYRYYHVL